MAEQVSAFSKESLNLIREAVDLASKQFGSDDIRTARVLYKVSFELCEIGRSDESIAFLFRALQISERVCDQELSLGITRVLTNTLIIAQKYSEALELCARLYEREEVAGGDVRKILASYQLGLCLLRMGQKERAALFLVS